MDGVEAGVGGSGVSCLYSVEKPTTQCLPEKHAFGGGVGVGMGGWGWEVHCQ